MPTNDENIRKAVVTAFGEHFNSNIRPVIRRTMKESIPDAPMPGAVFFRRRPNSSPAHIKDATALRSKRVTHGIEANINVNTKLAPHAIMINEIETAIVTPKRGKYMAWREGKRLVVIKQFVRPTRNVGWWERLQENVQNAIEALD